MTITIKPESRAASRHGDEDIKDIDYNSNPAYAKIYAKQIYHRHRVNEVSAASFEKLLVSTKPPENRTLTQF